MVDCWWGWLDQKFLDWVKVNFPYIRVVFVPACCTPVALRAVAQPMDAGIIAIIKGILRRLYGRWACDLTVAQFKAGVQPGDIKIPSDVQTCKRNLFEWLSQCVSEIDCSRVSHCWEQTELLRAWERLVQVEASQRVAELFNNSDGLAIDLTVGGEEDQAAGDLGVPFVQPDDENEWESWIPWDAM